MNNLPSAADYLPNWATRRIVILEPTRRWTSAIAAEVAEQNHSATFEQCDAVRDVSMLAEMRSTAALVLFLDGFERECMSLIGRLSQLPSTIPTLLVASWERHRSIIPALMEGGASHVLFDVRNDTEIADWICGQLSNLDERPSITKAILK